MIGRLSWKQRLAALLAAATGLTMLVAAGATAYLASVLARVDVVAVQGLDPEPGEAEESVVADDLRPTTTLAPGDELPRLGDAGPAENYLIIGSDDISGVAADEAILVGREEEAGNSLADAIMLLRLDPAAGSASLLSIPRDLWVTIEDPDRPFEFKINTAFNLDDNDARAARIVATVKSALDVPVHHFVHVNWSGFRRLVDTIGGVELCFETPLRDTNSLFLMTGTGPQLLDGDQALAYVRSRSMEQRNPDGSWVTIDTRADLSRIPRQQEFLRSVLDQTGDLRSITDLRQGQQLVEAALGAVEIDDTLDLGSLLDLVRRYEEIGGGDLRTFQLDVVDDTTVFRGLDVQFVRLADTAANAETIDIFRGVEPGEVSPSRVQLGVFGPGADSVVSALRDLGFDEASAPGEPGSGEPTTVIRYGAGGEDGALLVAAALEGRWRYEPDPSLSGGVVVLELGDEPITITDGFRTPAEQPPVVDVAPTTPSGDDADRPTDTVAPAPTTTALPGLCGS